MTRVNVAHITNKQVNELNTFISLNINVLNVLEWISIHLQPNDVFDKKDLKEWAEKNGYRK